MNTTARARNRILGLPALGAVLVAVAGCSVGDLTIVRGELPDSGAGTGRIPMDQFPTALARAICENIGPCCTGEGKPFAVGKCEASMLAAFAAKSPFGQDAGPYDAEGAGRCIDAFRSDAKSCFRALDFLTACPGGNPARAHARVGDACDTNCYPSSGSVAYDCIGDTAPPQGLGPDGSVIGVPVSPPLPNTACWQEDGLYCPDPTGGPRACSRRSNVGGPCSGSNACKDGWCSGSTCVSLLAAGSECSHTAECRAGLYCDLSALGPHGGGTCAEKSVDGTPCTSSESCASGSCDQRSSHECVELSLLSTFAPIACVQ